MRVLIVANYVKDQQYSMQHFSSVLTKGLEARGNEVRLVRPRPIFGACRTRRAGLQKWLGYADKYVFFRPELRRKAGWANVVHICDHSNAIYTADLQHVPHVVTCHDMLAVRSARGEFAENPTRWSGRRYQSMILRGLMRAQLVACVSEATRQDLLRVGGLDPGRVLVIHNGLNYPYSPMQKGEADIRLRRLGVCAGDSYFLHVGGNQWYKNRPGVVRMFEALCKSLTDPIRLVMAGKPWTEELRTLVETLGLQSVVTELSDLHSEDLRALYSRAEGLIFPSFYEGFGWPVVEAQACGCPVFVSNRAPLTEVAGDAAVFIDPADPDAAARRIALARCRRGQLREAGLSNAKSFSGDQMLTSYLDLYQEAIRRFSCAVKEGSSQVCSS